jgi:hypothetical protein
MSRSLFGRRRSSGRDRKSYHRPHRPAVDRLEDRALLDGAAATQQLQVAYGQLPLSFEVNQGQADPQVNFLARGSGYALFLTADEAVLSLQPPAAAGPSTGQSGAAPSLAAAATAPAVVRMRLLGANPAPQVVGQDPQPGVSNYFLGNDPSQWRTGIAHYGRVIYRGVYPGVDLAYYGNQQHLEYDFTVAPGADPQSIALAFAGAEGMTLDAQGDLVLQTASGAVVEQAPVMYQEIGGVKTSVAGSYELEGDGRVGFRVGAYDPGRPLVIDPVLDYSTNVGGHAGNGIAVDSAGAPYVTGWTYSSVSKYVDYVYAFVAKLAPDGKSLVYFTTLGGIGGRVYNDVGPETQGLGIAVDATGDAYVTGFTDATDFPTRNPLQPTLRGAPNEFGTNANAFVAKLAPDGALVYSTFLGGGGRDAGNGIAVDAAGDAYVTGLTESPNFPTTRNALRTALGLGGAGNAFVAKLAPDGASLLYSTYLGGSGIGGDAGLGIAVDATGSAYVTGTTSSHDFPITRNAPQPTLRGDDAFVAKLAPDGASLVYSTYLGGYGGYGGVAQGIAVDSAGDAYVVGWTDATNFPTTRNALQPALRGGAFDAFVAKLAPDGASLVYSTYLSGSTFSRGSKSGLGSQAYGIAVDSAGDAYVTGTTDDADFPTKNPIQSLVGYVGAFVAELAPDGASLVYSTLGVGYQAIAVDAAGNAYVTGGDLYAYVGKISAAGTPTTTTTPTPTSPMPTPAPTPTFLGELRLTAGTGRKKKVVGFELRFSAPLNAAVAQAPGHYRVTQPGRRKRGPAKLITVRSIAVGPGDTSVTLVLGKYDARKPLTLTAPGLVGADGTPAAEIIIDL